MVHSVEIGTTAGGLKCVGIVIETESLSELTCLSGVLRNMLFVPLVFNKVGPARPNFGVINPATLKLKTEIHINCEETQVQPPGEKVWIALGETETDVHTGCPQELDPSLEEGCDQDGDRLDIPA